MIAIRDLERQQVVGTAQAEALKTAQIKVIANTGDVTSGVSGVMELFSAKGGTAVGAAIEALSQTELGKKVIEKLVK